MFFHDHIFFSLETENFCLEGLSGGMLKVAPWGLELRALNVGTPHSLGVLLLNRSQGGGEGECHAPGEPLSLDLCANLPAASPALGLSQLCCCACSSSGNLSHGQGLEGSKMQVTAGTDSPGKAAHTKVLA